MSRFLLNLVASLFVFPLMLVWVSVFPLTPAHALDDSAMSNKIGGDFKQVYQRQTWLEEILAALQNQSGKELLPIVHSLKKRSHLAIKTEWFTRLALQVEKNFEPTEDPVLFLRKWNEFDLQNPQMPPADALEQFGLTIAYQGKLGFSPAKPSE